ncbi:family 12 glycosyl hydrolase [Colletotrichum phormii]|uniref:Family 12 glycosyl hydrolase n=1 Tax=Colletotrichum phormii TaxID=359342 RepID=A0AAI9ZJA4_9PEZI|nr:family 12 glycosyl hydrolase [Colletotrichum phormii]KAK1625258.1 family 12 glycosyl hydrolase [Colletotrichum phormii]
MGSCCSTSDDSSQHELQQARPAPPPQNQNNMPPPRDHIVTLEKKWGYHAIDGYELNNNTWGLESATSGSQRTHYDGPSPPGVSGAQGISWSTDWEWQGGEHNVKSYVYGARQFQRRLLSEIRALPTEAEWHYSTWDVRANVAYDIFTDPDKDHANSSGEFEVMIWLAKLGGVWPISESKAPIAHVEICGHQWEVHFGYNHGGAMKVYSFLPVNGPIQHFNADVKQFFNFLSHQFQFPQHNQYMLVYQLGTEAFTGGPAEFVVPKFIADVI